MESSITALSPIQQSAAYLKTSSEASTPWYLKASDSKKTVSSLGYLVMNRGPLYTFGRSRSDPSSEDIEDLRSQISDLEARLKESDPANRAEQDSIKSEIKELDNRSYALEARVFINSIYDKISEDRANFKKQHEMLRAAKRSSKGNRSGIFGLINNFNKYSRGYDISSALKYNSAYSTAYTRGSRYA